MTHQPPSPESQKPETIRSMFNAIAPTYDVLNHLLSFGLDIRWRRRVVRMLEEKRGGIFLDIATGSGDLALEFSRLQPRSVMASDFSLKMLEVFQQKIRKHKVSPPISILSADALSLPFCNESFDATTVAFGIRNFANKRLAMEEMLRVLKRGGISIILELSEPTRPIVAQVYTLYARFGLPLLGKLISSHNAAYRYLPESIAAFPEAKEFLKLMRESGFETVEAISLTFGSATMYVGRKS